MNEVLKELDNSENMGQPDVGKANPEKVAKVLDDSDIKLPENTLSRQFTYDKKNIGDIISDIKQDDKNKNNKYLKEKLDSLPNVLKNLSDYIDTYLSKIDALWQDKTISTIYQNYVNFTTSTFVKSYKIFKNNKIDNSDLNNIISKADSDIYMIKNLMVNKMQKKVDEGFSKDQDSFGKVKQNHIDDNSLDEKSLSSINDLLNKYDSKLWLLQKNKSIIQNKKTTYVWYNNFINNNILNKDSGKKWEKNISLENIDNLIWDIDIEETSLNEKILNLKIKKSNLLVFSDVVFNDRWEMFPNKWKLFVKDSEKQKATNVLSLYWINKKIDELTKTDVENFTSVDKANLSYSLAMVKSIETNTTNKNTLLDNTKKIYRLLKNDSDAPVLPDTKTLAVWDGGWTKWIDGYTDNYWKEFFNYDQQNLAENTKNILWTSKNLFFDLKVSWVDWPWADIFLSIWDKILKWHTEWIWKSWIIRENQADFNNVSWISVQWTKLSLNSDLLWDTPAVSLKVTANTFIDEKTWNKIILNTWKESKDEVLVQVSTNWVMDLTANPEESSWKEFFELWKHELSDKWKNELDNVLKVIKYYNDNTVDFNAISSLPILINAWVDYVSPTANSDFKTPRSILEKEVEDLVKVKWLDSNILKNLIDGIKLKTEKWELNKEKDPNSKNKLSDLVICRALESIKYILNSLEKNQIKDPQLISKIQFSAWEFKRWSEPSDSSLKDASWTWVKKDRFFSFKFSWPSLIAKKE